MAEFRVTAPRDTSVMGALYGVDVPTPPPAQPFPAANSVDWLQQRIPKALGDWLGNAYAEGEQRANDLSPRTVAGEMVTGAMNLMPAGRMAVPRVMGGRPMLTDIHGNLVEPGIQMNHVSPYDFNKPDVSKIGTGQGANSYGAGLYAATNSKVSGGPGSQYWNEFAEAKRYPNAGDPATDTAVNYLLMTNGNKAAAIDRLVSMQSRLKDRHPGVDGAIELLKSDKPVGPVTYQWNVRAAPEQFLDWSEPLSGQSPHVQEALGRLGKNIRSENSLAQSGLMLENSRANNIPFEDFNRQFAKYDFDPISAAKMTRDAGIPGIRYLDQGSRTANNFSALTPAENASLPSWAGTDIRSGTPINEMASRLPKHQADLLRKVQDSGGEMFKEHGTSNYVLFNDSIIDILKKWGLMGGTIGAGAASQDQSSQ